MVDVTADGVVVIYTAVQAEAIALARALRLPRVDRRVTRGEFAGQPIYLQPIGIGAVGLPTDPPAGCARLILAGFAGALDPALCVGDVVTDPGDGSVIATASEIVATAAAKAEWYARGGARAVDMEGARVAAAARRWGIPFTNVRAITDRADQPLNTAVLTLVDPYGRLRVGRLATLLLRRPMLLLQLVTLGRASAVAGRNLGAAIHKLLAG